MESVRLNNHNSSFVVNFKSGSNSIWIDKLKILHPLKKEEYEQIHLRAIDQKELTLYDKILSSYKLNLENSEVVIEESFGIIDHLTIEIVSCGFVGFDFEVYFQLKQEA